MEKLDNVRDLKFSKMYIDIGVNSKAEATEKVNIGDMGVSYRSCNFTGDYVVSKALDNRVGCAVLIKLLERLKEPNYNVSAVFTVQEEVGLRGAKTSAFGVNPDLAIAVDITDTGDTPKGDKMAVGLGKGPAIKVKDSSVLCHPIIKEALIDAAERNNIPYQLEVLERGWH